MKQLADSSSFRFSTADKTDTTKGIPSVLSVRRISAPYSLSSTRPFPLKTAQRSDDILASVRAELDRSVRKHLDAGKRAKKIERFDVILFDIRYIHIVSQRSAHRGRSRR